LPGQLAEFAAGFNRLPAVPAPLRRPQPRARPPLRADIHLHVLNNSYDRVYLCVRSVEMGT
jgi:hypothetical protein